MRKESMFDLLQKALKKHGIDTRVQWKPGAYVAVPINTSGRGSKEFVIALKQNGHYSIYRKDVDSGQSATQDADYLSVEMG